jgi:hypothetical protein
MVKWWKTFSLKIHRRASERKGFEGLESNPTSAGKYMVE